MLPSFLSFSKFYCVLPSFTEFCCVFFAIFCNVKVFPGFTGFYLVLPSFAVSFLLFIAISRFFLDLLGFT